MGNVEVANDQDALDDLDDWSFGKLLVLCRFQEHTVKLDSNLINNSERITTSHIYLHVKYKED